MVVPELSLSQFLLQAVVGFATLMLAGWTTARLAVDGQHPDAAIRRLLFTLAWGFGVVPTWAFFAHLLGRVEVSLAAVLVAGAVQVVFSTAALRARGDSTPWNDPNEGLVDLWRARWPVLAALLIGALWYVKHDGSVPSGSCVTQAAQVATGWDPSGLDLLRGNLGDNRLGNAGVLAGSMAVFGQFGFRMLYALLAVLLALGGWTLGQTITNRRWGAWLGLLLLPLNPYVASLPLIDENLLALSFSVAFLPLCIGGGRWWAIGALYGLCATMRHPLALGFPALALLAWRSERGWRDVLALTIGAAGLTAIEHLHHYLAFGSVLRFESNAYFLPQSYELLGLQFQWKGFLNWPLHSHLVRTPHNPFPTMVMWPLSVADHFGLVLSGLMLTGLLASWRRPWRAALWALWFFPVQASLMVQEAWDYPNKMGVILVVGVPLVAWILEGAAAVAADRRRVGGVWAVLTLTTWLAIRAAAGVSAPADARYFDHYRLPHQESQTWLQERKDALTDVGFLPDFSRLSRYGPLLDGRKLDDLGKEHRQGHSWGWHHDEPPSRGDPLVITLDLSQPPWRKTDFIRLAPAATPVDIDLVERPQRHVAGPIPLPWERFDGWLTAVDSEQLAVLELGFVPRKLGQCTPADDERRCRFYETFAAGLQRNANTAARRARPEGSVVTVKLPAGGLSFVVSINERGNVLQLWKVRVSADAVHAEPPRTFWHN